MQGISTLFRSLRLSLKTKKPWTLIVTILGFAFAFLPTLIAQRLELLTNILQELPQHKELLSAALVSFGILVLLFLAQSVYEYLQACAKSLDGLRTEQYIQQHLLELKCRVKYKYIENEDDFLNRLTFAEEGNGSEQAAQSVQSLLVLLQKVLTFLSITLALWAVNPWIVVFLLITSIPAVVLSYLQKDETFRSRVKWMEEGKDVIDYLVLLTFPAALQEIRHFNLFDYLKARWRSSADQYIGKKNRLVAKHTAYNLLADFLRSIVYIFVLMVTAYEIYQNPALGLGTFTLVFALSSKMQSVTQDLFVGVMEYIGDIPYMKAFFALDDLEKEPEQPPEPLSDTEIRFENVSFSYPGSQSDVLKQINVTIHPGEKIAIVGENGSGKSTFVNLLCGMFSPRQGAVYVGGETVDSRLSSVRDTVSVVFQDFGHYETTIRENISLSDQSRQASDAEILQTAKQVNALDVIDQQPKGLDEPLGVYSANSRTLSGGQWQKLALLRAAYRDRAKIMILDEPTAALDPLAETELYRDFAAITGDRTTILISHRLGITSVVDRILVFCDGEIIEDGSHQKLMEQDGHYAALYRAQAQWYQAGGENGSILQEI